MLAWSKRGWNKAGIVVNTFTEDFFKISLKEISRLEETSG